MPRADWNPCRAMDTGKLFLDYSASETAGHPRNLLEDPQSHLHLRNHLHRRADPHPSKAVALGRTGRADCHADRPGQSREQGARSQVRARIPSLPRPDMVLITTPPAACTIGKLFFSLLRVPTPLAAKIAPMMSTGAPAPRPRKARILIEQLTEQTFEFAAICSARFVFHALRDYLLTLLDASKSPAPTGSPPHWHLGRAAVMRLTGGCENQYPCDGGHVPT